MFRVSCNAAIALAIFLCSAAVSTAADQREFRDSADAIEAANQALSKMRSSQQCMNTASEENTANDPALLKALNLALRLYKEKERALSELHKGAYCSKCNRTASEIEQQEKTSFADHIQRVKGRVIPAPPDVCEKKAQEYDSKIADAKKDIRSMENRRAELTNRFNQCAGDMATAKRDSELARSSAAYLSVQEKYAADRERFKKEQEARFLAWEAEQKRRAAAAEEAALLAQQKDAEKRQQLAEAAKQAAIERRRQADLLRDLLTAMNAPPPVLAPPPSLPTFETEPTDTAPDSVAPYWKQTFDGYLQEGREKVAAAISAARQARSQIRDAGRELLGLKRAEPRGPDGAKSVEELQDDLFRGAIPMFGPSGSPWFNAYNQYISRIRVVNRFNDFFSKAMEEFDNPEEDK